MESDDEYEYEETTVVAEIQGVMDAEFLADVKQAKILGIDGDKPLLQLDDYTFSGHYEDTMGTCMLFKDVTNEEDPDDPQKKLEYSCLSFKKLCLQSVFLKKNDDTFPEKSKEGEQDSVSKPSVASDTTSGSVSESVAIETDKHSDVDVSDKNTDKEKKDSTNSGSDQVAGISNDPMDGSSNTTKDPLDESSNTTKDPLDESSNTTKDPLDGSSNIKIEPMEGT